MLLLAEFICEESTTKPPIDADTNLANPVELRDEEALRIVDVAPAMVAGKNNESTAKSPLTVKAPSANCKNWLSPLSPNKILLA